MKKIEAIIRKTKFEEVKEALLRADIEWFPTSIAEEKARCVRPEFTVA